jgi:hypothetical protein
MTRQLLLDAGSFQTLVPDHCARVAVDVAGFDGVAETLRWLYDGQVAVQ